MDPRKQPGWMRLASPGQPLSSYECGDPVWVYRGSGWVKATVESALCSGPFARLVLRLDTERHGGHPFACVYDDRNVCPRSAE